MTLVPMISIAIEGVLGALFGLVLASGTYIPKTNRFLLYAASAALLVLLVAFVVVPDHLAEYIYIHMYGAIP